MEEVDLVLVMIHMRQEYVFIAMVLVEQCIYFHFSCNFCNGNGFVICTKCNGNGKLVSYKELNVIFEIIKNDNVVDEKILDKKRVAEARGVELLKYKIIIISVTDLKLQHFTWSNHDEINVLSNYLIDKSNEDITKKDGRLLSQRITIKMVPVIKITSMDDFDFYCYGLDKEIYTPNYPETCCCCRCECNIL